MADTFACPKRGSKPVFTGDRWMDDPRHAGDASTSPTICSFCLGRKPAEVLALVKQGRKVVGSGPVRQLANGKGIVDEAAGSKIVVAHFTPAEAKGLK
jgi:hypothetical protein